MKRNNVRDVFSAIRITAYIKLNIKLYVSEQFINGDCKRKLKEAMIANILILAFCAALTFHITTRYSRKGRILSKIPGPFAYPFVGNLLKFNVNCLHEFWRVAREITRTYYPITRFWLCKTAVISVRHPDDIEILFSNPKFIDKGYIYEYLHPWLKTGLLTSTGSKWRRRRKILTPAFHYNILIKYFEIISEEGRKIISDLKREGNDSVKNIIPFCSKSTLRIICESAMGVSFDSMNSEAVEQYEKAVYDMGKVVLYRMPRPYLTNWMVQLDWNIGHVQENALRVLHQFTAGVIEDRMSFHKHTDGHYLREFTERRNLSLASDTNQGGQKKRLAMLDLLLAAENNGLIDREGIQEEVDTFTFEAHDTTAMAMTFTLMLLAENPQAQQIARNEVIKLFHNREGPISFHELQELDYLERCIKESLRLFPPVATLMRYTADELQLKSALIPADSHIMIHLYDTHRDPNFWDEPDKFDPDRFLPESSRNRHPFAYVPFSAGPRNCIGQKFALMELKLLIGQIIYNFSLEPVDQIKNIKLMADIVLRPLNSIKLKFTRIIPHDSDLNLSN